MLFKDVHCLYRYETAELTLQDIVRSPVRRKTFENFAEVILFSCTRILFTVSLFLLIETCMSSCHYTATFIVFVTDGHSTGRRGKIVGKYVTNLLRSIKVYIIRIKSRIVESNDNHSICTSILIFDLMILKQLI